jgi:hypothetical protein
MDLRESSFSIISFLPTGLATTVLNIFANVDAVGVTVQLFSVSFMVIYTRHTWKWMVAHHALLGFQCVCGVV